MARKREQLQTAVQAQVPCAWEGCSCYSFVRIRTKTGWANLCVTHYELHFAKQGDRAMTAMGLDRWQDEDREAWKKRVFAKWKELSRKAPMNQRLDEEAA